MLGKIDVRTKNLAKMAKHLHEHMHYQLIKHDQVM